MDRWPSREPHTSLLIDFHPLLHFVPPYILFPSIKRIPPFLFFFAHLNQFFSVYDRIDLSLFSNMTQLSLFCPQHSNVYQTCILLSRFIFLKSIIRLIQKTDWVQPVEIQWTGKGDDFLFM